MLSENQVKRLLKHCTIISEEIDSAKNNGWIKALQLVLQDSETAQIRKDPIND